MKEMLTLINLCSFWSVVMAAESSGAVAQASQAQQAQLKSAGQFNTLLIVLMLAVMYFLVLRPQRKKEKEAEKLRSNIDIGDEIVTIGGIIGTVVSLKDDFIVIETSGDRNKLRVQRWAIHTNNTVLEREQSEKEQMRKERISSRKK